MSIFDQLGQMAGKSLGETGKNLFSDGIGNLAGDLLKNGVNLDLILQQLKNLDSGQLSSLMDQFGQAGGGKIAELIQQMTGNEYNTSDLVAKVKPLLAGISSTELASLSATVQRLIGERK